MGKTHITVNPGFLGICGKILEAETAGRDWNATSSVVEFQDAGFCGGWDSGEGKFIFSCYENESESWFTLSMDDVKAVLAGTLKEIPIAS